MRQASLREGTRLQFLTIVLAIAEAVLGIFFGSAAGSVALLGFGLDSIIEVVSASAVVWRLRRDSDTSERERAELTALRVVGACFLALAAYIALDSVVTLVSRSHPDKSIPGVILLALSFTAMILLRRAKRRVAGELASDSMRADARQTEFCAYLSLIALGGVGLNAALGWWWADPVAALAMVPLIVTEGLEAVRGQPCTHV